MPELSFTLPSKRNFCNANENMINMIAACMFKFYLYLSMFHICLKCDSLSVCPVYRYFWRYLRFSMCLIANPPYRNLSDIYARTYGERKSPFPTSRTQHHPQDIFTCAVTQKKHICKGPSQKLETISDCLLKSRGIQHLFLRRRTRRSQI